MQIENEAIFPCTGQQKKHMDTALAMTVIQDCMFILNARKASNIVLNVHISSSTNCTGP